MYLKIDDPENYKVALYIRLSKEDDNKGPSESVNNQQSLLNEFVQQHRLSAYDTYIDDGWSGTNFDRPSFQRMIKDIEARKVNMVITKDLSRLGRDYILIGHYMERYFPEHQVRYISLLDGIDTGIDTTSNDITPFRAIMNDAYAKDISKKITSVKRAKQKSGQFIGGKAPYGYIKSPTEKNKIVVDEPAAIVVREIFQLALEGKSCREIAMILNQRSIPTPAAYANIHLSVKGPYSGKWSSERISAMLQNEVYIGSMVQGRVQKVSYKSKKIRKLPQGQWTVVQNTHEPLVDRATFEKVAMLIESRNRTRSRTYDYLLKGIIFCHECGHPLGVINRKLAGDRDTLYFVCRTYQRFTQYEKCTCHCARVEDVTNAVLEQIRNICKRYIRQIDLDEVTSQANKTLQAEKRKQGKDLAALKSALESISTKIDKSYDDKLSGIIDDGVFQRSYTRLKKEEADLRSKIQALESSKQDVISFDSGKIKELVEQFLEADVCTRELIVSLIQRIELTKDKKVLIFFKFKELDLTSHL